MERSNQKNSGWIWLHRKIRDNWIWQDSVKLKWWIDILLQVNHDEKVIKVNIGLNIFDCGRGQSIMSLQNWAERWNVSKGCARHFLTLLENDGMITLENLTKTTRITVCNFDYYNSGAHARETHSKRTVNARETHGDLNNNVNNVKNENNVNIVETNKFFNKNFSPEVNELFNEFIKQEEKDLNHNFNYRRLKTEIEKLKIIPAAEQSEVIKKALASCGRTLEPLTEREKASIGNDKWDWKTEYLNP